MCHAVSHWILTSHNYHRYLGFEPLTSPNYRSVHDFFSGGVKKGFRGAKGSSPGRCWKTYNLKICYKTAYCPTLFLSSATAKRFSETWKEWEKADFLVKKSPWQLADEEEILWQLYYIFKFIVTEKGIRSQLMSWMILVTCSQTWRTNWMQCSWRKSVKAWQTSNTVPLIVELLNYLSDCCEQSNIKTWQYFSDNSLWPLKVAWNHIVRAQHFYDKLFK